MAVYISSEFKINPNIAKKPSTILDSSWVFGSMVYANSVEELPTHPKLVRQGNLGSVPNPNDLNKSILYQANIDTNGIVQWEELKTGTTSENGGQEVYYKVSELNAMTQEELATLPDDILVVNETDTCIGPVNELLTKLMSEINTLQKEIIKIKNTFNDMSAVDIEEANSNYGTYVSMLKGLETNDVNYPRVEVDWTDSSNNQIVHQGTSNLFYESENTINWINSDSSIGWYEDYHDSSVSVYSSQILEQESYPYYNLSSDGTDVSNNQYSDGVDEKLTLRHFAPKYAKSIEAMNEFKTSLIPFELVLCLENSSLYFYDSVENKMVQCSISWC